MDVKLFSLLKCAPRKAPRLSGNTSMGYDRMHRYGVRALNQANVTVRVGLIHHPPCLLFGSSSTLR